MRYFSSAVFERTVAALPRSRQHQVKSAIRKSVTFFETGDLPHGLGFKPLGHDLWEIRVGLSERILFRKQRDSVCFLLVGNHDEVRRFLKNV